MLPAEPFGQSAAPSDLSALMREQDVMRTALEDALFSRNAWRFSAVVYTFGLDREAAQRHPP